MNRGEKRAVKMGFPFNLYLKQLFSADTYVKYINPFSFWRRYKIDCLNNCYEIDTVKYLENCRKLDCQAIKQINIDLDIDYTGASVDSLLRQVRSNTIYISQPSIKLKYRGVSYYIRDISNIDIDAVEIDPRIVRSNSPKYTNNLDRFGTSKQSGSS